MDQLPDLLNHSCMDNNVRPYLIGVCGGTASGKTSVCRKIISMLEDEMEGDSRVAVLLHQDSFYKVPSKEISF
eukprot:Awhi_evm1s14306